MIEDRNVQPGAVFAATYKGIRHTVEAKGHEDGNVRYVLDDGSEHKSLSAAGSKLMGGIACNGWRLFSPANAVAEPTPKAEKAPRAPNPTSIAKASPTARTKAAAKPKGPTPTKAKPPTKIVPRRIAQVKKASRQDLCPEGQTRYWCSACMDAFCVPEADMVTQCPQGHEISAIDDLAPIGQERELATADA